MTTAPLRHPDALFIGGHWEQPSTDATVDVINASTEDLFARVALAQQADIDRAVAAARLAFDEGPWPRMSHAERAAFLTAIAREFDARADDLARIWTIETGVLFGISRGSSPAYGAAFDSFAAMAESFPFEEVRTPSPGCGDFGLVVREPVGVVAAIVAWNGPAVQIAYKCAPALLAGCTLVVKPAPDAPTAGYVFAEICEKVGLPAGVVNVVTADREMSELLVRHPGVDKVAFTGSTAAGQRIGSICGERVARCSLELGGKSPAIILDDYDVEEAAVTIAGSTAFLTGQACIALTRIIVTRERHDAMVEALSAHLANLKVGDPFDPATQMGPLASRRQRERVEGYIAKGLEENARIAYGGGRPKELSRGFFIEPTVFADVSNELRVARDEIFGPVLCVIPAGNEEEAVRIANDTCYGLAGTVFTNDIDRAYAVSRQLRAGMMGQNALRTDFALGFGGFKQSGIGREGGAEGLLPYVETKTLLLDKAPTHLVAGKVTETA
jgi:acyl-CoA reductase-like NAD-dependent aldehyde dehydrogenase